MRMDRRRTLKRVIKNYRAIVDEAGCGASLNPTFYGHMIGFEELEFLGSYVSDLALYSLSLPPEIPFHARAGDAEGSKCAFQVVIALGLAPTPDDAYSQLSLAARLFIRQQLPELQDTYREMLVPTMTYLYNAIRERAEREGKAEILANLRPFDPHDPDTDISFTTDPVPGAAPTAPGTSTQQ